MTPSTNSPQAAACPVACGVPPLAICTTHIRGLTAILDLIGYHLIDNRARLALREDFFYHLAILHLQMEQAPATSDNTTSDTTKDTYS